MVVIKLEIYGKPDTNRRQMRWNEIVITETEQDVGLAHSRVANYQ